MDPPAAPADPAPPASAASPRRLYLAAACSVAAGIALWLAGFLTLTAAGRGTGSWNAVWGLAGVSFLSAVVVPIPGFTATTLFALRDDLPLGSFAVVGAALGSTAGAAILLALGNEGRQHLQRRATHSRWARRTLAWSVRLARKWTYAGVAALLVPQFIPKLVVLYAAVLVQLRTLPFLAAVFLGVGLRNLAVLGTFALLP